MLNVLLVLVLACRSNVAWSSTSEYTAWSDTLWSKSCSWAFGVNQFSSTGKSPLTIVSSAFVCLILICFIRENHVKQKTLADYTNLLVAQCASYYHHLITDAVFNISSDLMMLALPLPLLIKAQLPFKKKLVLCAVFSLGVFVILSAVLNRYYNFTAGYGSLIYLNWYAGETSTAVIVANIPHCWPLLSRLFGLGSFKSTQGPQSGNKFVLSSTTNSRRRPSHMDMDGYLRSESEERIANKGAMAGFGTMNSPSHETTVELGEIDKGSYTATAAGGNEDEYWNRSRKTQFDDDKDRIVKTVQLHQYSS